LCLLCLLKKSAGKTSGKHGAGSPFSAPGNFLGDFGKKGTQETQATQPLLHKGFEATQSVSLVSLGVGKKQFPTLLGCTAPKPARQDCVWFGPSGSRAYRPRIDNVDRASFSGGSRARPRVSPLSTQRATAGLPHPARWVGARWGSEALPAPVSPLSPASSRPFRDKGDNRDKCPFCPPDGRGTP
jgi:hypothetical protein